MSPPTISSEAKKCLELFTELSILLKAAPDLGQKPSVGINYDLTILAIDDARARFRAWGTNIAAFHDSSSRTSLDSRLKEAPGILGRASQVLTDLREYLTDVTLIISGRKVNETWSVADSSDSSDSSEDGEGVREDGDDGESTSSLQELLKAILASISSLMKLSILIRSSPNRDDYMKAASRYNTWSAYPDIGHVREKYGSARYTEPWLLDRLGKTITRRRQFLKYRGEHHEKMTVEKQVVEMPERPEKSMIASTKATTFVGHETTVQNIPKPISEAGSFGSLTSYDPTVFGTDGAPTLLTVPSPPKMAFPDVDFVYGEPFQCPYCFTEQIVKNKSAWKKHVFRDLKPYVCTFEGCAMLMFKSRKEWFAHELKVHRREWFCQFCDCDAFPNKDLFEAHTKSAHQSILANSSLDALLLQSEDQVARIPATACHLCNDWEEDLRRKDGSQNPQSPTADGDKIYGQPKQFRRHLGRHMEQMALFALPQNAGDDGLDDDSSQENDSGLEDITGDDVSNTPSDAISIERNLPPATESDKLHAIDEESRSDIRAGLAEDSAGSGSETVERAMELPIFGDHYEISVDTADKKPPLPEWIQRLRDHELSMWAWRKSWQCHCCPVGGMGYNTVTKCPSCSHIRCSSCAIRWNVEPNPENKGPALSGSTDTSHELHEESEAKDEASLRQQVSFDAVDKDDDWNDPLTQQNYFNCCNCNREIEKARFFFDCPGCNHRPCVNCKPRQKRAERVEGTNFTSKPGAQTQNIETPDQRRQRWQRNAIAEVLADGLEFLDLNLAVLMAMNRYKRQEGEAASTTALPHMSSPEFIKAMTQVAKDRDLLITRDQKGPNQDQDSGSGEESDYSEHRRKASTRSIRVQGDEDFTLKVAGQARVLVGGTMHEFDDSGKIRFSENKTDQTLGRSRTSSAQSSTRSTSPQQANDQAVESLPGDASHNKNSHSKDSEWSLQETTCFPLLLMHFGTDWEKISHFYQNKTATMVRSFYEHHNSIGNAVWEKMAKDANKRRALGLPAEPLHEYAMAFGKTKQDVGGKSGGTIPIPRVSDDPSQDLSDDSFKPIFTPGGPSPGGSDSENQDIVDSSADDPQINFYWRLEEQMKFPNLLRSFGTDWDAIAAALKTKTTRMVKEYYDLNVSQGGNEWEKFPNEWEQLASDADRRIAEGKPNSRPPRFDPDMQPPDPKQQQDMPNQLEQTTRESHEKPDGMGMKEHESSTRPPRSPERSTEYYEPTEEDLEAQMNEQYLQEDEDVDESFPEGWFESGKEYNAESQRYTKEQLDAHVALVSKELNDFHEQKKSTKQNSEQDALTDTDEDLTQPSQESSRILREPGCTSCQEKNLQCFTTGSVEIFCESCAYGGWDTICSFWKSYEKRKENTVRTTPSRQHPQEKEDTDDDGSSRSSMSGNYHSSSRSKVYHDPTVVHKFRDWDSNNLEGAYKYSPSNKILVINHNAPDSTISRPGNETSGESLDKLSYPMDLNTSESMMSREATEYGPGELESLKASGPCHRCISLQLECHPNIVSRDSCFQCKRAEAECSYISVEKSREAFGETTLEETRTTETVRLHETRHQPVASKRGNVVNATDLEAAKEATEKGKRNSCPRCPRTFSTHHETLEHLTDFRHTYTCNKNGCPWIFETKSDVLDHVETHNEEDLESSNQAEAQPSKSRKGGPKNKDHDHETAGKNAEIDTDDESQYFKRSYNPSETDRPTERGNYSRSDKDEILRQISSTPGRHAMFDKKYQGVSNSISESMRKKKRGNEKDEGTRLVPQDSRGDDLITEEEWDDLKQRALDLSAEQRLKVVDEYKGKLQAGQEITDESLHSVVNAILGEAEDESTSKTEKILKPVSGKTASSDPPLPRGGTAKDDEEARQNFADEMVEWMTKKIRDARIDGTPSAPSPENPTVTSADIQTPQGDRSHYEPIREYSCPRGLRCDNGGVNPDSTMKMFKLTDFITHMTLCDEDFQKL